MTQTQLSRIPENKNFLQPTKFTFLFPTLPFLRYFVQSVNFPGVSTSGVTVNNPFSNTYRHGDTLNYDDLRISAYIDEDLRTWEETHKWLISLTTPGSFSEYVGNLDAGSLPYHDGILTLNTNANNQNIRVRFTNCHPTDLGGVSLDQTSDADITLTTEITFRYDQLLIERLS